MQSIHPAQLSDKQNQLLDFVRSETEKVYMIIGAEEIGLARFMGNTLNAVRQMEDILIFNYEIWPQEHSRHFLYRWLDETVSGSASMVSNVWHALNDANPQLKAQLKLLKEKDRRPLEVRFLESIRFVSEKLKPEQRLLINLVPLTDVNDPTLVDFFKSILRLLPAKVKMLINQCEKDVLAQQDDFCPSNRIKVNGVVRKDTEKILEQYYRCYHSQGVKGRLMRTLVHMVHPVGLGELAQFIGASDKEIKEVLQLPEFNTMVVACKKKKLRLAYPRLFFSKKDELRQSLADEMAGLDKKVLAYYQKQLSRKPDPTAALYHSLGVYRISDTSSIVKHALAQYQTKLEMGAGEMSELELQRALGLMNGNHNMTQAQLMLALAEVRETLGRNREALETLETVIQLLQKSDRRADLQHAFELKGRAAFALREIDVAKEAFQESLTLARELDQTSLIADILSQSGYLHFFTRQLNTAENLYKQALEQYENLSQTDPEQGRKGMAVQWSNLGHTSYALNDFVMAETCHRKALKIYEDLADEKQTANQWGYLGHTFFAARHYDKAIHAYERAAELDEKSGDSIMAAQRYANMGHSMYAKREPELANRFFNKALTKYKALGNLEREAAQLSNLGLVKGDQGEFEQAIDYFNQAKRIYDEMGDQINATTQIIRLGHVRRAQQDFESAKKHYQEALNRYRSLDYPLGEGDIAMELGHVNAMMQDFSEAIENYNCARRIFAKLGHKEKEAICLVLLGQVRKGQGEIEASHATFNNAVDLYNQMENQLGLANVLFQIGLLQFDQKNYAQAEQNYREALSIFRKKEDKEGEANLLANLGTLHYQTRQLDKARKEFIRALDLLRKMNHPSGLAGVLVNLSFVYEEKQDYGSAHDCLKEALKIYQDHILSKEAAAVEQRLTTLEQKADLSLSRMREELVANTSNITSKAVKVKRNALCPCGSGKKYKKCCGR